jgi:formamidopyrimidine-DNA glycosylase
MTGWIKFSTDDSSYYKPSKEEDKSWPPRFMKFELTMEGEPECKVAFVDARRLGRIRLVDCEGDKIRTVSPLKENGPDPVVDSDILTREWLGKKLKSKKVPVKALLLDQGNISGVGNWVALVLPCQRLSLRIMMLIIDVVMKCSIKQRFTRNNTVTHLAMSRSTPFMIL